jgi:hypothetical protein
MFRQKTQPQESLKILMTIIYIAKYRNKQKKQNITHVDKITEYTVVEIQLRIKKYNTEIQNIIIYVYVLIARTERNIPEDD